MMKLQVYHRTHHAYAAPVRDSFNEARLEPVDCAEQTRQSFLLKVLPATRLSHFHDFYRNCVHVIDLSSPHQELTVEAVSVVVTRSLPPLPEDATPAPVAALPACERLGECYDFLQASTYVRSSPEAWRLALDLAAGHTDVWQIVQAIMRHLGSEFRYIPAVTNAHTTMEEALRLRQGVCQDFAHVMIGLCRALRIPARYVSGYLYNGPTDQLKGTQATHAWVDVYIPNIGWRGLDPTNQQPVNQRHVKVAIGRDYADVSPLRGTYRGTASRKLSVEVLVTRLDHETAETESPVSPVAGQNVTSISART
jgi:transglutaminase-like putative cysteine protease